MAPLRICVYGSSSRQTPQEYYDAAYELGKHVAEKGDILVNGGGRYGTMGAMNIGCREAGGKIVAVIHERFVVDGGVEFKDVDEMIVCGGEDLQERKKLLIDNSDCILVMPGGLGTLDEFCEALCMRQLHFQKMPIAIVNVGGYYDHLVAHLHRCKETKLLHQEVKDLVYVADTAEDAIAWCRKEAAEVATGEVYVQKRLRPRFWIASLTALAVVEASIIGYLLSRRRS
uniref:Cytokinin riboside 5'-monophosphate phosphoribohydrolase n=1 Tax=Phaeomonas parva TaxID=124430 RepID=A0A7S1XRH6_9STRA|mmetsp:Transcript_32207/g.102451  ORF Transcript_32207/g.102451 Transcript_32207/m.102451 type:complete len:229 (+) Transcript_32207:266-952(+)|eukprot:CAMPEP_0118877566 /NCGR_PEP_ID=MMETSP1163-20130328/17818_1 /TAXON_ID=124430 /ORGANISM="Phaeomonas parva, Strain CCMP2877" /LENGTH=228 /DNA_ID=CAMNT_0006813293 /DNA_START=196 /DNA_END=882 /DNA_ORIENTATION=-